MKLAKAFHMNKIEYSIAKEFSRMPGLRYRDQSPYSGEEFRDDVLIDLFDRAVRLNAKLEINLDNTFGYGPSFLEEAFGGLARVRGTKKVLEVLSIVSNEEPYLIDEILEYVKNDVQA